jgi:hypothetical protein
VGRYRFAVDGMAFENGAPVSYSIESRPFTIAPSTKLAVSDLAPTATGLSGKAAEPPLADAFFLRSEQTPGAVGAALSGQVTFRGTVGAQAVDESATIAADGTFMLPVAAIANGPPGDYRVELTITDALGNLGTVTATVTK